MSYCTATYRLYDDKADFRKKAESIAVGMTVGSWTELPQAKRESMQKHLGQVLNVKVHEPEGAKPGERYADVTIAYPDVNFSKDIPALLVTVFGKISMDGRIKLNRLGFSDEYLSAFPGPKFGIGGIRDLLGVHDRPLLMSIFKSVIGLDMNELRDQFVKQALGGVDLIKDDEILFENELTPIEKRVEVCLKAAEEASRATGKKLLYAANLTGHTSNLKSQALKAINAGANALLFNVLSYGYDVLHELSSDPEITVPIAAHPALAGAFYPSPHYGISASVLLGQLMRLAGADLVLFPSPYGSVTMPREENMAIRDELLTDGLPVKASMPVPSAGIHPGLVPLILRDFGQDVVVNAGGGIHGHPMGTEAGGRAFVQAIEAAQRSVRLADYAEDGHPELKAALEAWGGRTMKSGKKTVIFCDFDGTITLSDNIVAIMKEFKPEGYEAIMQRTVNQEISLREGVGAMFALLPSGKKEEIVDFVVSRAGIREGFREFLGYVKQEGIDFYVTSGGMDFFIDPLLAPFDIPSGHIFCNSADFSGDHIEILWPHPCQEPCRNGCGMCKTTVMRRFPEDRYERILIGDSLTDFEGAKIADLVYSRSILTDKCAELGVKHVPFQDFFDIMNDMKQKRQQGVR